MKLSALLIILAFCGPSFAQAIRVKAEHTENEKLTTAWGTASEIDGKLVTCSHVLEKAEIVFAEYRGSWIRCEVSIPDKNIDIAVLLPDLKIELQPDAPEKGCHCFGSPKSKPVRRFDAKFKNDKTCGDYIKIEGFAHGMSGSPVLVDGKIVAICTGFASLNGVDELKDRARYIPIETVRRFLK